MAEVIVGLGVYKPCTSKVPILDDGIWCNASVGFHAGHNGVTINFGCREEWGFYIHAQCHAYDAYIQTKADIPVFGFVHNTGGMSVECVCADEYH